MNLRCYLTEKALDTTLMQRISDIAYELVGLRFVTVFSRSNIIFKVGRIHYFDIRYITFLPSFYNSQNTLFFPTSDFWPLLANCTSN